ncbi:hypothetical protein HYH03_003338 [Edaphochlamys debaryana]|uniref:Uncharacterized protein n=1 Tax=Edaphochlamys debaryana TaxID=47281 RepID=A0A835Y952_9CHLO|nr:hypothetical protein HYH03_003338 [Edaphochlamys debaryana]|eukprot:KAG2498587.1 hypothetical protein HYH03_003338 [Edaphochlamys debaryana]
MGKMDPTQMDRWWKSRIQKEEQSYGVSNSKGDCCGPHQQAFAQSAYLNTLGQPAITIGSQMAGAGAIVSNYSQPPRTPNRAPSVVESLARSNIGGLGRPHTPGSQALGGTRSVAGTDTKSLMMRLEGLESALSQERVKRMQAEEEMRQLMQMAQGRFKK